MEISKIKNNAKNPKRVKASRLSALVDSLLNFPEMLRMRPIIVNDEYVALDGNHRLKAIKRIMEMTDFEFLSNVKTESSREFWSRVRASGALPDECVFVFDGSKEAQTKLIALSNISAGQIDVRAFAMEYDNVDEILKSWDKEWAAFSNFIFEKQSADDVAYDIVEEGEDICIGDIYKIGESFVLCEDFFEADFDAIQKKFRTKIDVAFADPPFDFNDTQFVAIRDILLKATKHDVFIMGLPKKIVRSCVHECFSGFFYHNFSMKVNSSNRSSSSIDLIAHFLGSDGSAQIGGIMVNNYISARSCRYLSERWHEHQKPKALAAFFVKNFTVDGDCILDAFSGSGTMLIAAEESGRRCICIEKDPSACSKILRRAEITLKQKPKKIS